MSKRIILITLTALFISVFLSAPSHAITLLTKDEALQKIFGTKSKITVEKKKLKGKTLKAAEERLGGSLVFTQEGSESAAVRGKKKVSFYFASRDGKQFYLYKKNGFFDICVINQVRTADSPPFQHAQHSFAYIP